MKGGTESSFAVRLRRFVDTPLQSRPLLTWPAVPFLFLCSLVVALEAARRRARDDKVRTQAQAAPAQTVRESAPFLVCLGNVVAGGSGKSPLVRAFAEQLLSAGESVAIVSRGYGARLPLARVAAALAPGELGLLSDEMREHVELLRLVCGDAAMARLYLAQNPSRRRALAQVASLAAEEGVSAQTIVALMDDGLQHFSVRPDVRICVWKEDLAGVAPSASLPLGPYREGFFCLLPRGGFASFYTRFDVHVWSRLPEQATAAEAAAFRARVAQKQESAAGVRVEGDAFRVPHLIARSRQEWLLPAAIPGPARAQALATALREGRAALLCGLGQPDAFVAAVLVQIEILCGPGLPAPQSFLLPDHGTPSATVLGALAHCDVLVLSAKDWYRLAPVLGVLAAVQRGHAWVLCVKVRLEDLCGNSVDPVNLLAPFRSFRD